LRHGHSTDIRDIAGLLRALAVDNIDTGKWKLFYGKEPREVSGVFVLHGDDASSYRNGGDRPLSVTFVSPADRIPAALPSGATLTRHIYRLNGVELLSPAKPVPGDIYIVEIKGTAPDLGEGEKILIQDGSNTVHPLTCPLSTKLDTLSFMPWLTTRDLTPIAACEFSAHAMNAVLASTGSDSTTFSLIYVARIDAGDFADIPATRMRILK